MSDSGKCDASGDGPTSGFKSQAGYIIDATAAPVCIIAPISSWAAAVTSSVPEEAGINGFSVFIQTIPYNLYAILTLCMLLAVTILKS